MRRIWEREREGRATIKAYKRSSLTISCAPWRVLRVVKHNETTRRGAERHSCRTRALVRTKNLKDFLCEPAWIKNLQRWSATGQCQLRQDDDPPQVLQGGANYHMRRGIATE